MPTSNNATCRNTQSRFSAYLDGAVTGVEMASLGNHLDSCHDCATEFAAWRNMQTALNDLGPARSPDRLQARLRLAISAERERNTHLPLATRWARAFAPLAYRGAGGLALTLLLVGGVSWMFAAPLAAVEANDDEMGHLTAPRYLYSQVPPQPINSPNDAPILVEARTDSAGRIYDYEIVSGPVDGAQKLRIEQNLLASVFKPATVFGEPANGHVMLTYAGITVHG